MKEFKKKILPVLLISSLAIAMFCILIISALPNAKLPLINTVGIVSLIVLFVVIGIYIIGAFTNFFKDLHKWN